MAIYHYILLFVILIPVLVLIFIVFAKDINLIKYIESLGLGGFNITTIVIAISILIIIFVIVGFLFSKATKYWY